MKLNANSSSILYALSGIDALLNKETELQRMKFLVSAAGQKSVPI